MEAFGFTRRKDHMMGEIKSGREKRCKGAKLCSIPSRRPRSARKLETSRQEPRGGCKSARPDSPASRGIDIAWRTRPPGAKNVCATSMTNRPAMICAVGQHKFIDRMKRKGHLLEGK